MKVRLQIQRDGAVLHDGTHEVSGADSFGGAFAHAWTHMIEQKFAKASSVGALFEIPRRPLAWRAVWCRNQSFQRVKASKRAGSSGAA